MSWQELITSISIGSIFDLKTKYKDFRAKIIALDFYGFDAVLPLKEISNNYELSLSLFNTINEGEIISSVLINIDDKNQRLTFSTKVFRNALDNVLPFTHCVNLINSNFRRRRNLPNNFLLEQRKILDRLRGDLSSNELTFLYELIQNAVDHPNRNFKNQVNINFEVFNNYLLVKHNGALFTENNFESITGILYGEQIQEGDRNRIGYKGIGFKSVFRFTENAYIRSGNFSFRFSKEESGSDMPWEVLPIFQLEKDIVPKIPQFEFFNAPVAFAFEFNSEQSKNYVIKYLNQLSQNPYLLIFLENLTKLKIKTPSLTFSENGISQNYPALEVNFIKEVSKEDGFDSINLLVNNRSHSEWLIYTKDDIVLTDEEVINELLNESNTSIPAKMRQFRTPRITIALPKRQLNNDVINLFTYLPLSNTKYKLPFVVNADFIPDLSRTDIIGNLKYNTEVLKFVAITLQEFSQKLANVNRFEYLNTLLPDFKIEFESSAKIIVEHLLNYLHSINITSNGQQIALSKIAIDKSSFVNSFGKERYKSLIDSNNEPISEIYEYKSISRLIEKINPDGVFDFDKLKEKVRSDSFKEWIKNSNNNSKFLKYLYQNNRLEVFSDELIFLAKDGALYKRSHLLISLGADESELKWLNFNRVLHGDVLSTLEDIKLPLPNYEPISFINEIICKEKKVEIIEGLTKGTISFDDFYSYLSKYAADPLFPTSKIKEFPIKTLQGTLPSWSGSIYFNTISLNKLSSEKALPEGLFQILDDKWSNGNFKLLAEKLGVLSFLESEPFNFLQNIIVAKKEAICSFYLSQANNSIISSASLWSFILSAFNNLSDPQKESLSKSLKAFPVLSKKGEFKEVHRLYLPSEFTDNDALETLSLQFPHSNIEFVSAVYLEHPSIVKEKITSLFKKLGTKTETKDFLQHTLLPNLSQISSDLIVPLTRLIYDNRDSELIMNLVRENTHFKLKTKEGNFKPIKECYIGTPYIDENQIPNPLPSVPIENQISEEYSTSHLDAWRRFFSEKLKVRELNNEPEIISLKLRHISNNAQFWQTTETSVSLVKNIYRLYKSGNLLPTNLGYLRHLPLLCKLNNSFYLPSSIHFSSTYKPIFDFEKIFGIECGVPFLSEFYKFEDTPELIQFFEHLGVTQTFDQHRHSSICRNIPTADGQKKPASQLFNYEFKKYVGESNVAFEDLSKFKHNGKTLEELFGFKSKLDVSTILNYISKNEPNRRELKDLITELLMVYNPQNYNDRNLINEFIKCGKLLSTAKSYNKVSELHSIDESIRSGIRENEYLIDPLFSKQEHDSRKKYYNLFRIKTLRIEDFNPHFEGEHIDNEFSKRVEERLVLLAFDSDNEKYREIEDEFKKKFKEWKIKKCFKISLKYPADESKIVKEDNRNFILLNDKTIYYIGNWIEQRNFLLVHWLNDNILNIRKQLQFVQDILLNNPSDIIADFENKGRVVPYEIKQRFRIPQPTQQKPKTPEPTQTEAPTITTGDEEGEKPKKTIKDILPEATEEELEYISKIININKDKDGQIDANTTAKIKALKYLKTNRDVSNIADKGLFLQVDGVKIFVRSAQKGLLYLDLYTWGELNEMDVEIAIFTNNEIRIFDSQEALFQFCKPQNTFGVLRMPNDYTLHDYNNLNDIKEKSKWHFVFIVNKDAKSAKSYEELLNLEDYNY
jgi:mRNA-degrading endonuclease YafQ of YafQ-DinJ toxin-antitoxin module